MVSNRSPILSGAKSSGVEVRMRSERSRALRARVLVEQVVRIGEGMVARIGEEKSLARSRSTARLTEVAVLPGCHEGNSRQWSP